MTDGELNNTTTLLARYRDGDESARDDLVARYLPTLTRWARGRLPRFGRDLAETDDLVQITFMRALNNLGAFETRRPGAFLAYLRTILLNHVREELRRSSRRPPSDELKDPPAPDASVVETAIGADLLEDYEQALEQLKDYDRQAVILRVEFGMTYPEIALELGSPSANSVRMTISRALARMATQMQS